jgi:hypothetical protein
MRTRNLDEAIDAVSKVYCPHTVELTGRVWNTDAVPEVHHSASSQPLVGLSYRAPVNIDAENSPRLFFMMHCARGSADTIQQNRSADWRCRQLCIFPPVRYETVVRPKICAEICAAGSGEAGNYMRALALPPDVSCAHVRGRIAPGRYC